MSKRFSSLASLALTLTICLMLSGPVLAQAAQETLVVYSGRSEGLIGPILAQFTAETGIAVEVRYGATAEMAATILEEGRNSPADVFIAQDAGALGALAAAERLLPLPSDILERVPDSFVSADGLWVGLSGRARVLAYNTDLITPDVLPASILDLTAEGWQGRVGWAPTNASFQAHATAMRVLLGEAATRDWLLGMANNGAQAYENNRAILQAIIDGEIAVGLINHYYLYPYLNEDANLPVGLHFFPNGDVGTLINIAGAGIVDTTDSPGLAQRLILYLLGNEAQAYFAQNTYEYPLVAGIPVDQRLVPLSDIEAPAIDLSNLDDLQTTLDLLLETGVVG